VWWVVKATLPPIYPREWSRTHYTRVWVPLPFWKGAENPVPHRDSTPCPWSSWTVAIQTKLAWPTIKEDSNYKTYNVNCLYRKCADGYWMTATDPYSVEISHVPLYAWYVIGSVIDNEMTRCCWRHSYPEILHVFISVPDELRFSETSVSYQLTWRHIPEDLIIHQHLCDCLKCCKSQCRTVTTVT
jgi:hypothetical protein